MLANRLTALVTLLIFQIIYTNTLRKNATKSGWIIKVIRDKRHGSPDPMSLPYHQCVIQIKIIQPNCCIVCLKFKQPDRYLC